MLKKLFMAIMLLSITFLASCSKNTNIIDNYGYTDKHKVIIDVDSGADDCAVLILAAKSPNIEILGVTVLAGNVSLEQGALNALMALEIAGSDAKVYKGADSNYNGTTIETFSVFGNDGMGDLNLINPKGKAEDANAIDFMLDTINKYPNEVEIISLGPATNIAKAIDQDLETMKKVKNIYSLGSAGLGEGNASPVSEFNVYLDAYAYKVMLDSNINITTLGLDMCSGDSMWTKEQFENLKNTNGIGKFVSDSFTKLIEFYKSNGSDTTMVCDPLVVVSLVFNNFVKLTLNCHASCITDAGETFGQVIYYKEGFTYDAIKNTDLGYNVKLINQINKADYFNLFLDSIK